MINKYQQNIEIHFNFTVRHFKMIKIRSGVLPDLRYTVGKYKVNRTHFVKYALRLFVHIFRLIVLSENVDNGH